MQRVSLFSVSVLCLTACVREIAGVNCVTPPFDKRRCYQLYRDYQLSWDDASTACRSKGQRLASAENGKLLKFINDNIAYYRVWIGLRRAADGQVDRWTSGQEFIAGLYPDVVLNVSRAGLDDGKLCSITWNAASKALTNEDCNVSCHRICETVKGKIYEVRNVGDVVKDVTAGQPVAYNIVSVFDCVRKCNGELSCQAVSHDGVTCQLHFLQTGHNIVVTSNAAVYTLLAYLPEA